jgi:hypothetical protein
MAQSREPYGEGLIKNTGGQKEGAKSDLPDGEYFLGAVCDMAFSAR